ncbi:MAG: hypothetical protein HOQ21_05920, partial [Dermatophilaceae bacterium]|nr:hypothetical protein [Dermatophilaceae bacterium]
ALAPEQVEPEATDAVGEPDIEQELDYEPETNPYGSAATDEEPTPGDGSGFSSAVVVDGDLPTPPESPSGDRPPTA